MAATLSSINAAIMAALTPLQCPDGGIVADSRPFAYVGHWCGEITRERGVDPEALAQFPCALLHWPGEKNSNGGDLTTMDGDGEDAAQSDWVVYVGVEDVRGAESLVVGASGVPGALALSDLVIGALDGLLIDGLLRSGRLYYTGAAPFVVARGKWYVAALTFFAKRSPDRVAPPDDAVPLLGIDGDVNLVETRDDDDPENPVDQFVAETWVPVSVSGTVYSLDTGLPISGVTVSIVGDSGTVATDADGEWTLETQGSRDVTVRCLASSIRPTQTTVTVGASELSGLVMYGVAPSTFEAILAGVGVIEDPADGAVFAFYDPIDTAPAGFGLTLTPSSGTWIAPDPPTLSTTTSANVGALFVANITPGTVTMAPTAPGGSAVALAAHVSASQVVTAGTISFLPCDWT